MRDQYRQFRFQIQILYVELVMIRILVLYDIDTHLRQAGKKYFRKTDTGQRVYLPAHECIR